MRLAPFPTLLVLGTLMYAWGGLVAQDKRFSRADTLRGMLTPLRTCYDVTYYHLDVRIDPSTETIRGSNTILFSAVEPFIEMQIDLFANLKIEKILFDDGRSARFSREFGAVFVTVPEKVAAGSVHSITVFYSGTPIAAKRPPWEGGLIWEKDDGGNPWVAVTCQGTGASLWWPNKDHQSDEPDSMLISVTVPPGLENISNGRLRGTKTLSDGWTRSDWFVHNPINNYDVTINAGKFVHFSDFYVSGNDTLALDYYVKPGNVEKARSQFQQVKPMMACFEKHFGKYPFYEDGYKLVESPHLGMEHQSAIAYGNWYLNGYRGEIMSAKGPASPIGLKFDFIIVHETAHEWWGNSVTSKDVADMWIHESFGAYAEAIYVECLWGYDEALAYINAKRTGIKNTDPITGTYNVQRSGSTDMYNKGQIVLNTLRSVIDNDSLWFAILHGLATTFRHQTITADDVVRFVNTMTKRDLTYFFDQYFCHTRIPQLEVHVTRKGEAVQAMYRWNTDVQNFAMPIKVTISANTYGWIYPTTSWQTTALGDVDPMNFRVADSLFYVDLKLGWSYLDPHRPE